MNVGRRVRGGTFGLIVLFVASACGSSAAPSVSPASDAFLANSIAVSTTAGDIIATEDLVPVDGGIVKGTGPDGTTYKLEIPAFALSAPMTVSMRPLAPAQIDGGQLVVGVELEPAGTTFALPVILTITPATGDAPTLVPFAYTGTPGAATATMAMTDSIDSGSLHVVVPHFSGLFAAKPNSPDVQAKWEQVGRQPNPGASTPEQQAAWATAAMAAAKYAVEAGKAAPDANSMDAQTKIDAAQGIYDYAKGVLDHASVETVKAQMDEWDKDTSKVNQMAKDGNLDYATEFLAEVDKVAGPAMTAAHDGQLDGNAVIKQILDVTETYLGNIAKSLETDPTFQKSLKEGTPDGLATLTEIAQLALHVEREVQLLGRPDAGAALLGAELMGWLSQYAHTFGARCVAGSIVAPIGPMGYAHQMALLGDDDAAGALVDCAVASAPFFPPPKHTPDPCPGGDLWLGPPVDGTQVAEVPICGPGDSGGPAPPPPGVREPVLTHGRLTGHSTDFNPLGGWTNTTDLVIEADLVWNVGLDYTSMNAIRLTGATYKLTGSASGICHSYPAGGVRDWPMSGSLAKDGAMAFKQTGADFEASDDVSRVSILLSDSFQNGKAWIDAGGMIQVPFECDGSGVTSMTIGTCDLKLAITSPGVLDGSCKSDTSDDLAQVHTEWTAHFAP